MATKTEAAKEVVLSFIDALNQEDFEAARKLSDDDLVFKGVMGSRNSAKAYFADMKKMKLKYKILKAFADGDDVSVFYNIDMSGKSILTSGWYHLKDGKIDSIKVIFDPRPILEQPSKN